MGKLPWILLLMTLVMATGIILNLKTDNDALNGNVNYYRTTDLNQESGSIEYPNYDPRSLDGGKNLYAVKSTGDRIVILGPAETVYPGLLDQIVGMDELADYARKNGPIPIDSITPSPLDLLKRAGIEVKSK